MNDGPFYWCEMGDVEDGYSGRHCTVGWSRGGGGDQQGLRSKDVMSRQTRTFDAQEGGRGAVCREGIGIKE
jgi:hypothetical protein